MTDKYRIHSIWYSKPHFTRDGHGEVLHYRIGITITEGLPCDYDGYPKKVSRITFNEGNNNFEVYFEKGGLKVIPMLSDTEVVYELINEKSSK